MTDMLRARVLKAYRSGLSLGACCRLVGTTMRQTMRWVRDAGMMRDRADAARVRHDGAPLACAVNPFGENVPPPLQRISCMDCGIELQWRGWGNPIRRCRACKRAKENAQLAAWRRAKAARAAEYRRRDYESYVRGSAVSPTRALAACDAAWAELLNGARYESVKLKPGPLFVLEPVNPEAREL